jgi:4-hydroxymandelate oxidase
MRDRDLTRELVRHAVRLGASALVLTGDTPVVGRGDRDRDLVLPDRASSAVTALRDVEDRAMEQAPDTSFADLEELVAASELPVLVKGVLRGDDARACVDSGAAGVVVSNHGGRQLDGAVATADALPDVVAAVSGRAEILVDGGIRTGVDVLRALALGATATLVGRPVLWGLAVAGADGVRAVLDDLRADVARALTLAGARTCADVNSSILTKC